MSVLRAIVVPAAILSSAAPMLAQTSQTIAEREIARRQDDLVVAQKLVAQGDRAFDNKDYENAYVSYLDALDKVPNGSASGKYRAEIMVKFSKISLLYAQSLVEHGHFIEAEQVAKTVLLPDYAPNYKPAIAFLSHLEQSDYFNKTVYPAIRGRQGPGYKWLTEAQGFFPVFQSARYDLAMKRYEQVLNVDPYNTAARKGQEQVNLAKSQYYATAYNETRARMLWEVEKMWEQPVKRFNEVRSTAAMNSARSDITGTAAITDKLNRIIIPKVDLQDATVADAVEFLKQRSRELDTTTSDPSQKRGVNIVLKLPPPGSETEAPAGAAPGAAPAAGGAAAGGAGAPAAPAVVSGNEDTHVTLALTNVPLIEALRYLTELAKLKYKVEPYAVSIVPLSENNVDLATKEYRVPPSFIPTVSPDSVPTDSTAAPAAGGAAGGGGAAAGSQGIAGIDTTGTGSRIGKKVNAQDFLQSQGVPFPEGASAQYVASGSKLVVRNTPDALDLVDILVDAANSVQPTQVEIESKFVEVTQDNLNELGIQLAAWSLEHRRRCLWLGRNSGVWQQHEPHFAQRQ